MASPLRLAVYGVGRPTAERAWRLVVGQFANCDRAMSRFRDDSELTRLNRSAGPDSTPSRVGRRLRQAVVAADRAGRVTNGRFDGRVLADLERLGYRGVPIDASATQQGQRWLAVWPDGRAALRAPVDLGGIGKGLALRWAADDIRNVLAGGSAIVEAGGDVVTIGAPPTEQGWLIEMEDPFVGGSGPAVIAVRSGAIATSSGRIQRWRGAGGRDLHHLIDPRTGEPGGAGLAAVTVHGADPAWAEVWSKALFIEGSRGIADLARANALAAWWIHDDGRLEMTSPARVLTAWTAAAANGP